jgi:hypothetical protein
MIHRFGRGLPFVVGVLALGALCARGEEKTDDAPPATTEAASPYKAQPSDAFAKKIDDYINKRIEKEKLTATPVAEDAEWLRRVWLDIDGGQPEPNEVIAFLASQDPDKRRKKVDELLAKEDFARNWAEFWTDVMDGESTTKRREDQIKTIFRNWFQDQLSKNTAFDDLTKKVVAAEGYIQDNGAVGYLLSYTDMGNQPDPKTLAATTARVFMGLQIECAQCHDHPFADWKRDEFMSLAAFFARAKRDQMRLKPDYTPKELAKLSEEERAAKKKEFQKKQQMQPYGVKEMPKGDFYAEVQTVRNPGDKNKPAMQPTPATQSNPAPAPAPVNPKQAKKQNQNNMPGDGKYLVEPQFIVAALKISTVDEKTQLRQLLGRLITDPKNPFFAKNCANRIWGRLTGRPLVAPSEDMSDTNAPHDPALLDLLAKGFRDLKCDHKAFVRSICLTNAYARSSRTTVDHNDKEQYQALVHAEQAYAVGVVRPIDARPLARAMIEAITLGARSLDDVAEGRMQQGLLGRFERLFGESNMDPKKYEETIPQALFLINGQGTNRGGPMGKANGKGPQKEGRPLTAPPSAAIATLLQKYDDPRERVTRLYLAALCRPPHKAELDDALGYLNDAGGEGDAYEDLLWALVNSAEFRFNR